MILVFRFRGDRSPKIWNRVTSYHTKLYLLFIDTYILSVSHSVKLHLTLLVHVLIYILQATSDKKEPNSKN